MDKIKTLYIIGGEARVGKNKVAEKLMEQGRVGRIISIDELRVRDDNNDPDVDAWNRAIKTVQEDDSDSDMVIVGVAVTPERTYTLEQELKKNISVKAIFIGYGEASYGDIIIQHAEENPYTDYVYWDERRRKAVGEPSNREIRLSEGLEQRVKKYGYTYYGAVKKPTAEEHVQTIINSWLN